MVGRGGAWWGVAGPGKAWDRWSRLARGLEDKSDDGPGRDVTLT